MAKKHRSARRSRPAKKKSAAKKPAAPTHHAPVLAEEVEPTRKRRLWVRITWYACLMLLLCGGLVAADYWISLPADAQATYVGSQACAECHQKEYDQWIGSHHERAMDRATPETVLGDFDNAELTKFGVTSRMFRQGDKFLVHTEGPDGKMQDFEVKYVLGYTPLQQYMVEFDRLPHQPVDEVARVQVLRETWDTEREEWFYLMPPDVDTKMEPNDPLHWTKVGQNWNHMCADCHSTNLYKNHHPQTDTYHTTWSEISVGCEACHGPGSLHVKLANAKSLFWDRHKGYALPDLKSADGDVMMHACFRCHSRRRILDPHFQAGNDFYDHFANELLSPSTYHADGQILDEVYVHGSFIQSKMYDKGVRCTDCHNPHTAKIKFQGNTLCTSCHMDQHPAGKYDTPAHHHHQPDGTGALCVECHMPESTYMAIDPRRDHSFKSPRPDLSQKYGTPNTCTRCHLDRAGIYEERHEELVDYQGWIAAARDGDEEVERALREIDQWSLDTMREWYGDKWLEQPEYASTLSAAWQGNPEAGDGLSQLALDKQAPAMLRATAVRELMNFSPDSDNLPTILRALKDPSPQVRAAAVSDLGPLVQRIAEIIRFRRAPDPQQRRAAEEALRDLSEKKVLRALLPLLDDPSRFVRTETVRVLAVLPDSEFESEDRELRDRALEEFKTSLAVNSDQAGSHMTMGDIYDTLAKSYDATGDRREALVKYRLAAASYRSAIRVQDDVVGPRSNLASVLDRIGETKEEREEAKRLRREELELIERDVHLLKQSGVEDAGLFYRYGMLLYLNKRNEDAEAALKKALELEPDVARFVAALALLYKELQRWDEAIDYTKRYLQLQPYDSSYLQLLRELEQAKAGQLGSG